VFGLRKFDSGEPARNTATIINDHADTVEAALIRGGIAPADTQALLAKWPGTWQNLPLVIAATGFVTGHGCQYRTEAGRVWCKGWSQAGTSGVAGNASYLSAALPSAYRPVVAREAWPIGTSTNRPYRVIVNPDGTMVAADSALTAGQFLNWDHATWPLG